MERAWVNDVTLQTLVANATPRVHVRTYVPNQHLSPTNKRNNGNQSRPKPDNFGQSLTTSAKVWHFPKARASK